jgi:hypothetical protein
MSAHARAWDIMIVLTHVVACDGQKAKLIAILDKIALLHITTKNKKDELRDENENGDDVISSTRVMYATFYTHSYARVWGADM